MNLIFHTVFSISTAPLCAKKIAEGNKSLKILTLGFIGNIIGHGIMDLIPHNYPFTRNTDVLISFGVFLLSMLFVKKEYVFSVSFCFLGGVLPDLIDKAFFPIIGLRNLKIFPWHWATTINVFYNQYSKLSYQSINIVFKMFNILVIIVSLCLLLINVKFIVHHMLRHIKTDGKKH
ncbi:hypothetical protein [Clostridium sp. FP1]|uniref:hypothetical protein n=1 Tax=Clostridium sp. FP1 TaxID=2724076 RepID=UPI0013E960C8|nr:hypothetical protein [Clostridium sp. FP1]MBZ9634876.1 hypothetical protein [Clostridium sp. FP1]